MSTTEVQTRGIDRFDTVKDRCVKMFGTEERFLQEASFLLGIINDKPELKECTGASIIGVMVKVASCKLSLNSVLNECYVIARNMKVKEPGQPDRWEKRACVTPSYIGLCKLATDTGSVKHFEAQVVYKGDQFEFDLVNKVPTVHKPYWTIGAARGAMIGAYGFATLVDGSIIPEHMGADELAKIRSKSDNAEGAVYKDWEGEMARKALLKRLQKHVPRTDRSEAFLKAIEIDNEGYDLSKPTQAAPAALTPDQERQKELMAQVLQAFKIYKGTDKAEINKKLAAEAGTNKLNLKFWEEMLFKLTPEPVEAEAPKAE